MHYDRPNPQIDFANSPFYVCDKQTPWQRSDQPRRAGISSFGVGGTNAHVILEEAPSGESDHNENELPLHVFPVSAKTETALTTNIQQLGSYLQATNGLSAITADLAATLQRGRDDFAYRAAVVAADASEAATMLLNGKPPQLLKRKSSARARNIVFMFPGQGAQYVRMGQDIYEHSSLFRNSLDECAELLKPLIDRDLREVLFPPTGDELAAQEILKATQFTQPALFSLGYSLAKLWQAWGFEPAALLGHSIGEFAAACTAGVFALPDALAMIAERGRSMQALPAGSMMSVRLPGAEVETLLWGELAIGSYNGPELCVVAGPNEQVAQLQQQLEQRDVICRHLHTLACVPLAHDG